jgi:hypothetical protein
VLKYTLGALAAMVIVGVTAVILLAQVRDGSAGSGTARLIVVSVFEREVTPSLITVEPGEIIDIRLDNNTDFDRAIILLNDAVEQLPELSQTDGTQSPRGSTPGLHMLAGPHRSDYALARFNEPGEYLIDILIPGVFLPGMSVTVVVE